MLTLLFHFCFLEVSSNSGARKCKCLTHMSLWQFLARMEWLASETFFGKEIVTLVFAFSFTDLIPFGTIKKPARHLSLLWPKKDFLALIPAFFSLGSTSSSFSKWSWEVLLLAPLWRMFPNPNPSRTMSLHSTPESFSLNPEKLENKVQCGIGHATSVSNNGRRLSWKRRASNNGRRLRLSWKLRGWKSWVWPSVDLVPDIQY